MSYELPIRRRCSRRTPTVENAKTPFVNDTEPPVCAVADRPWRDKAFLKNRKTSLLTPVSRDIRHLTQILARYRAPSPMRSIVELVIMFGLAPAYLFIVQHRLPVGLMRSGWRPWLSTSATNLAIAALVATMIWLVGIGPFLLVHLPIMLLAASAGVWLFYVQHQFENTLWAHDQAWNLQVVALHGSSHYALPSLLRWFTANVGIHHIHHLCSRIPYYRLPLVLRDYPALDGIGRLSLPQSLRCVRLALWDEGQKRLVSFREVRQHDASVFLKATKS